MKQNKKVKDLYIEDLITFNTALYYVFFDLNHFQRKYRPFFKFSILSSNCFFIHFKATKHGLRIDIQDNNYFKIQSTKQDHIYEFN